MTKPRKIKLVDTICSELDSGSELVKPPPGAGAKEVQEVKVNTLLTHCNMELEQLLAKVNTDIRRLRVLTKTFTAANVTFGPMWRKHAPSMRKSWVETKCRSGKTISLSRTILLISMRQKLEPRF